MSSGRRIALVTGGSRGLGAAISRCLHELGLRVVVTAPHKQDAHRVAAALGKNAHGMSLDVTQQDSVACAHARIGDIDILVNNAGVLLDWDTCPSAVPLDLVERELAVNVLGAWRVSQAFVPSMVARGWGRVVMVSSGAGAFSNGLFSGAPGYSISKVALNALTVLLANETRGTGVLVNAVNPGLVRTRMRPDAEHSPEAAAMDITWAATLPDDGPTGTFLRRRRPIAW